MNITITTFAINKQAFFKDIKVGLSIPKFIKNLTLVKQSADLRKESPISRSHQATTELASRLNPNKQNDAPPLEPRMDFNVLFQQPINDFKENPKAAAIKWGEGMLFPRRPAPPIPTNPMSFIPPNKQNDAPPLEPRMDLNVLFRQPINDFKENSKAAAIKWGGGMLLNETNIIPRRPAPTPPESQR